MPDLTTEDFETYYRAVTSRDSRFDGRFFTGVTSTGIYCRPICPARTPKPENVRFFRVAAAAEAAGFRTCRRCRPDRVPGSPEWNVRADLAARALRLIADGACDTDDGVAGLASHLAVSERHLHRTLVAELGVGPLTLARSRRAQTARLLLEATALPVSDVAFASGYSSIRQFNDSVREAFGATPTELRARAGNPVEGTAVDGDGALTLRLGYREPFDAENLFGWLGARTVPGVDEFHDGVYRRALRLPHGTGVVELSDHPQASSIHVRLTVEDLRDVAVAVRRCRDLLDLDADPGQVNAVLGADPALAPLVAVRPGLRVPGCVDGFEIAIRAVLGQQISVAAARTLAGRLVERFGDHNLPLSPFPAAEVLAELGQVDMHDHDHNLGITGKRIETIRALAAAVADGELTLDRGVDRTETRAALLAIPGVGPWTADYVALRAFGDPDAFPVGDLVLRRQAAAIGLPDKESPLTEYAERWRPWRSYATLHLWASANKSDPSGAAK